MANRSKYARKYLSYHKTYEKRANTELRRTFKTWAKDIKWNELQSDSYGSQISNTFDIELLIKSYIKIYRNIGIVHGKRVGKDINVGLKEFTLDKFLTIFEMNIGQFLRTYGISRIVTVRKQFFEYISNLLENRLSNGLTMREAAKEIQKIVNRRDFYRWQALRIARTESTAASNYAASQAGTVSNFVMVKEWISTLDARTRWYPEDKYDHREMNGKIVGLNESFKVNEGMLNEDALLYPGDPKGQAGNIINCRCTVVVVAKRDKNGDLIPTS